MLTQSLWGIVSREVAAYLTVCQTERKCTLMLQEGPALSKTRHFPVRFSFAASRMLPTPMCSPHSPSTEDANPARIFASSSSSSNAIDRVAKTCQHCQACLQPFEGEEVYRDIGQSNTKVDSSSCCKPGLLHLVSPYPK